MRDGRKLVSAQANASAASVKPRSGGRSYEGRSAYYDRGGRRSRRRILAPTLRDGACRGAGFVARLANSTRYWLRLASRHHPRQAARRARAGVVQRFLISGSGGAWHLCLRSFLSIVVAVHFVYTVRMAVIGLGVRPYRLGEPRRRRRRAIERSQGSIT